VGTDFGGGDGVSARPADGDAVRGEKNKEIHDYKNPIFNNFIL
jgi:hypothetical protein